MKRTLFALSSWLLAPAAFAILDTNNNGVSDFWEKDVHNGSLFAGYFDLFGDTDADGWTNGQEAAAGTNPFDPNPPDGLIRPDIIHTPAVWGEENGVPYIDTPEAVTVTWPTIAGKRYRLLVSPDLSQGSWIGVPNSDFIGNGNIAEFHFTTAESDKLFWRVCVEDIDSDGDGLNDYEEHKFGTNPASPMTHPGIPDAWLAANFPSAQGFDPNDDSDGDSLTNALENRLGTDPNNPDVIGLVNPGFGEEITDSPDMTFRDDHPSDLYDQSSVEGWEANEGQHIEIWDEGDGNPYAELQSHLGAHGIKQEFDMVPGTRLNFILRYKGRYDWEAYDNAFTLEVQGASEMLVDGAPADELDGTIKHSFMDDDESEKYADWKYVSVSITAETSGTGLKQLTLKLAPKTTTTYGEDGEEDITYGGFVDILPTDLDVNADGDLDDSCDGLALYMPGYEGNQPKLHSEDSFKDAEYTGPQSMNIIIDDLPSGAVDEATVRITSSSAWFGFCGNGKIPNDSPILSYNDFSLTGDENVSTTQEITISVTGNQVIIPIYCHDYGAWCEVEIDLLSDSSSILSQPLNLTVPHDGNEDRLADLWQDSEITAWNDQFGDSRPINDTERDKMKPGPGYDYPDYADDEEADSDGENGPMPAMAEEGDELKVIDEYRGFILDGGPNTSSPGHHRLSTARKELLVECSEMEGIGSTAGSIMVPGFTDQGNDANNFAQSYSLTSTMSAVAAFYAAEGGPTGGSPQQFPGAAIDMWWVVDILDDAASSVVYENGNVRSAYKYSGSYYDQQLQVNRNSWLSVAYDDGLRAQDQTTHDGLYGVNTSAGVGILANNGNRNSACSQFIKLALQGRKGKRGTNGQFVAPANESARERDERHEANPAYQGSAIFVNSLSEETAVTTQSGFSGLLGFTVAHELAHLFISGDDDHYPGTGNVLSEQGGANLSTTTYSKDEIENTKLPEKASIIRE